MSAAALTIATLTQTTTTMKDALVKDDRRGGRSRDTFWLARRAAAGVFVAYVAVIAFIMLPAIQT
jgi:hypothetical protein